MRIDQIKEIAEVMREYDLSEFDLESEELSLSLRRPTAEAVSQAPAPAPAAPVQQPAPQSPAPQETGGRQETAAEESAPAETIDSPIVGTFYRAPSPEADPFVKAGDEVQEDTVVCVVEAMKVMNEIKAEKKGRVKRVLLEDATPVEYGQPLIELETA